MPNDAVFPLGALLANYDEKNESRVQSSKAPTELERLYLEEEYCESFQLGGFSDIFRKQTQGIPVGGADCFTGGSMATEVTSSRASSLIYGHSNNGIITSRKRENTREICNSGSSKRQKSGEMEMFRSPPLKESPSSHTIQQTKAPVKRSQKLGDKITALQQLVSPFGKTDTASVLQETTACIKILHEQIQVLTAPYFQMQSLYGYQIYGGDERTMDLQRRGLCLAPISQTIVSLTSQRSSGSWRTGSS